jgi:hypothetical protein
MNNPLHFTKDNRQVITLFCLLLYQFGGEVFKYIIQTNYIEETLGGIFGAYGEF